MGLRALLAPAMLFLVALACGTPISDIPVYSCPTPTPMPTASPTPYGTPLPPGWVEPLPTAYPTPYIITPPQDFYVGDAIYTGNQGATQRLRFRLRNVQVRDLPNRNLVMWQLEIRNLGTQVYETIPVALMMITRIFTEIDGAEVGTWRTSESAMRMAGFTHENYDPLYAGDLRVYQLAAYTPPGTINRLTYLLDGDGINQITWINSRNPYCSGDIAD